MRRPVRARRRAAAVALAAALSVAACKVDVDGAPCAVPGDATDCPSGQACGNDLRCSERAAACSGTRCDVGARRCAGPAGEEGGTDAVLSCTAADPVCGAWELDPCASRQLVCGVRSGQPACECPPAVVGAELAADPAAGSPDPGALPFPTGAPSPPECRFGRLGDALAAAAGSAGAATVRAYGNDGAEVAFGDADTGEAFPLDVAPDVTLIGAAAPAGASVIRATNPTLVELVQVRGRIEGFRVEALGPAEAGVSLQCGGAAPPSLADVAVDGGHVLAAGIEVENACGADLARVDVANAFGPAARLDVAAGAPVTIAASRFHDSGSGIRATGGKLVLGVDGDATEAVEVTGNAGEGVVLGGSSVVVEAQLFGATVSGNGGTGIVLDNVPTSSKLTIRTCEVSSNGTTSPRTYGPGDASSQRPAGGILVRQDVPFALVFEGNQVFANDGDQLAFESTGTWSISPGACGAASNVFVCIPDGRYGVAVLGGGTVDASYSVWPGTQWVNYVSPRVTATYCNDAPGAPTAPVCPAP